VTAVDGSTEERTRSRFVNEARDGNTWEDNAVSSRPPRGANLKDPSSDDSVFQSAKSQGGISNTR
jgi:hypothetical protein